jgi:hypothetical protein
MLIVLAVLTGGVADMMTNRQKILSYLHNRKGVPVTIEQVAIGSKLAIPTVGPALNQMWRAGFVLRMPFTKANRKGKQVAAFIHSDFRGQWLNYQFPDIPAKRIPYAVVLKHANELETAVNTLLTLDHEDPGVGVQDTLDRLQFARIARDSWRDVKGGRPGRAEITDAGRSALRKSDA